MPLKNFSSEQIKAAAAWCYQFAVAQGVFPDNHSCLEQATQAFADEFTAFLQLKDEGEAYDEFMDVFSGCIRINEPTAHGPSLMSRAMQRIRPYVQTDSCWSGYGDKIWFSPEGEVFAAMSMATPERIYPRDQ